MKVFDKLKPFKKIIVTGPRRSGTTIRAQMLAHDFGLKYVDENDIGLYSEPGIRALCENGSGFVLQCPRAAYACHKFNYPDVAVVFMYRNSFGIKTSQDRINWTASYQHSERQLYEKKKGSISTIKYNE